MCEGKVAEPTYRDLHAADITACARCISFASTLSFESKSSISLGVKFLSIASAPHLQLPLADFASMPWPVAICTH